MASKPTKEEIYERILKSGVDARTDDVYVNAVTPMTFYCSKGHRWPAKLGNVTHNHQGCPYCSGRYPIVGETDLWTTNQEIAMLLLDKNDGYRLTRSSGQKTNFICPNCGEVLNRSVHNVFRKGLTCSVCGDGISYPNKFMASMLSQLKINYIPEFHIDGAAYRYDFYVPLYNMIIEMHGRQHYEDWLMPNSSVQDVQNNDKLKLDFAISHNIQTYICIDARNSDINYISSNIVSSELKNIFDLSIVDWRMCGYYAASSMIHAAAQLYNTNYTTDEIATCLKVHVSTIYNWLTKATELKLCTWVKSKGFLNEKRSVVLLNTMEIFESVSSGGKQYNVSIQNIIKTCQKTRSYAGIHPDTGEPMVWRYIEDYNENEIIDFMSLLDPRAHYKTK